MSDNVIIIFKGKQTENLIYFFALKLMFTMFYITCNFLRFFTFTISEKTEPEYCKHRCILVALPALGAVIV